MNDAELDAAYRSAIYTVEVETGVVSFTFAGGAGAAGAVVSAAELPFRAPWAIITACNPNSDRLADQENEWRMQRLRADLVRAGLAMTPARGESPPGLAQEGGAAWNEPSFLVEGLSREWALVLARVYEQRAVVFGDGTRVGLLFATDGRLEELTPRSV